VPANDWSDGDRAEAGPELLAGRRSSLESSRRRLAAAVDFSFVRGLVRRTFSHTGPALLEPVVLVKIWLLGYLFIIIRERRLSS
jgi:hypothetical protein